MKATIPDILDQLEAFYGKQEPGWPTDPYSFLVWWHCGYPAGDAACARGWQSLNEHVGVTPDALLAASSARLIKALSPGGMLSELRAVRLKEIAASVQENFGGDLNRAWWAPLPKVRKILKEFPGIADPGVDRILLFGGVAAIAAVPSNCPHVLVRIQQGLERGNYGANYRIAQRIIADEVVENCAARSRAYLLLKRHGHDLCKRTNPKCQSCPVRSNCAYPSAQA